MAENSWFKLGGGGILVDVKVLPGAARSEVCGLRGGALLVRVAAPPEKGRANDELRACLAKALGISKSEIDLVSGQSSRRKRISLPLSVEKTLRALVERAP
jgi:uncharacterized protein (TIGR00251 family)